MIWKNGKALDCQIFPLTEEGRLAFSRHVAALPGVPAYLLTDLVEEDFRNDIIPHVIQRDRRAILERKLSQIYRSTHYRLGIVQGREPDGRRDDRVLYTAITNPELIRPWIELLLELGAPLAGIYSAPLLSGELLKALKITSEHTLLTSVETGGGLRQSYFHRGEIKFSRLTPVSEISNEELPVFIADEVGKTWQYLDSLRYFTRADTLNVCILAHASHHADISGVAPTILQLQYQMIDIGEAAARIGLKENLPGSDSTPIFLHLLGTRPSRGQFAGREETHGMRIWRARASLYAASAVVLATSALWSGFSTYLTLGKDNEMQRIEESARQLAQQYQVSMNARPRSPIGAAVMRDSVTLYDALVQKSPSITRSLREISHVLDRFPNIRVQQIVWGLTSDANSLLGYTPIAASDNSPLRSSRIETATPTSPPRIGGDNTLVDSYQTTIIEADIYPFNGDYRAALREIEQFVDALKTLQGAQISTLMRPVDLTSNATLSGRSANTPAPSQARFAVKLTTEPAKP